MKGVGYTSCGSHTAPLDALTIRWIFEATNLQLEDGIEVSDDLLHLSFHLVTIILIKVAAV